jgi:hypothetical protein
MGTKPSNNFQSDRPESGGADRDQEREKSGLLEREKREFAKADKAKGELPPRETIEEPEEPEIERRTKSERESRK